MDHLEPYDVPLHCRVELRGDEEPQLPAGESEVGQAHTNVCRERRGVHSGFRLMHLNSFSKIWWMEFD